jgi:hypothetical protein
MLPSFRDDYTIWLHTKSHSRKLRKWPEPLERGGKAAPWNQAGGQNPRKLVRGVGVLIFLPLITSNLWLEGLKCVSIIGHPLFQSYLKKVIHANVKGSSVGLQTHYLFCWVTPSLWWVAPSPQSPPPQHKDLQCWQLLIKRPFHSWLTCNLLPFNYQVKNIMQTEFFTM